MSAPVVKAVYRNGAYDHAALVGYRTVEVPRADGSWEQMEIVA